MGRRDQTEADMPKFLIDRDMPGVGDLTPEQLRAASLNSCNVLGELGTGIQWVQSYVTGDRITCVYIAANEQLIREHARRSGFPQTGSSKCARPSTRRPRRPRWPPHSEARRHAPRSTSRQSPDGERSMSDRTNSRLIPLILVLAAAIACQPTEPTAAQSHESAPVPSAGFELRAGEAAPELARARAATARYHDLEAALADGYVDIDVVMPLMGHHYLRNANLDATFQADAPEILVYAPHDGRMRLVALEYAVPLALAANPPEGFSGSADRWDRNEQFQLWTLHAWVWYENPDGVFAPMNPRVE